MINKENLDQMLYTKILNMLCSGGTMKSAIQAKLTTKKNNFFLFFSLYLYGGQGNLVFRLDI